MSRVDFLTIVVGWWIDVRESGVDRVAFLCRKYGWIGAWVSCACAFRPRDCP